MKDRVGIIDIGSNSIKALVAERSAGKFGLNAVHERTLEVRISKGISRDNPSLAEDRMKAGVDAVVELWRECVLHGAENNIRIVATSAVRSASNGVMFMEAISNATGCMAEILSGEEEAEGIALGVRTDPAIGDKYDNFTVFDLGGGSLELIRFEEGQVRSRTSLHLGSVRLTERFFSQPEQPVPEDEQEALEQHVRATIESSGIDPQPPLIGCSGGLAALRQCLAEAGLEDNTDSAMVFKRSMIEDLRRRVNHQSIGDRIHQSHIPSARADIFPAALITFAVVMEMSGADELVHSFHNLRYGLAWSLLRSIGN